MSGYFLGNQSNDSKQTRTIADLVRGAAHPVKVMTAFMAAFLLFAVQPALAKALLPTYGGNPVIWIWLSFCFQVFLLIGYAAALKVTTGWPRSRHIYLMCWATVAVYTATFGLTNHVQPALSTPSLGTLLQSAVIMVGPSSVLLATVTPVLHALEGDNQLGTRPVFTLYAASNAGSLLGLLAYPALVERTLPIRDQMFFYCLLLCVVVVLQIWIALVERGHLVSRIIVEPRRFGRVGRWVAGTCISTGLVLALTAFMTVDVAAIPLLWIAPLAAFLMSFIVAFGRLGLRLPAVPDIGTFAVLALIYLVLSTRTPNPSVRVITLYLTLLFCVCLALHTRLRRSVDDGDKSHFYLATAIGGVCGGLLVTGLAPSMFDPSRFASADVGSVGGWIYRALTVLPVPELVALLTAALVYLDDTHGGRLFSFGRLLIFLVLGAATASSLALALRTDAIAAHVERLGIADSSLRSVIVVGGPLLMAWLLAARGDRVRAAGFVCGVVLVVASTRQIATTTIYAERSQFGLLRVTRDADALLTNLFHGTTIHGMQRSQVVEGNTRPAAPQDPLAYYGRTGPVGEVVAQLNRPFQIAVVGLGAGTMAAYAHDQDSVTFYELDPAVIRIATDVRFFSYLRGAEDRGARIRIIPGDGRLALSRERASFRLIIIDAFSSDAIPTHLLTVEALRTFGERLTPDGLMMFHISNRYFDLEPVVGSAADDIGCAVFSRHVAGGTERDGYLGSHWLALSCPSEAEVVPALLNWNRLSRSTATRSWTDDFARPLEALRRR
jgi:hypothetical protein